MLSCRPFMGGIYFAYYHADFGEHLEIVHNMIWTFKLVALLYKSYYALRGLGPHLITDASTAVAHHDCEGVTLSLDPPLRFHPRPDSNRLNQY